MTTLIIENVNCNNFNLLNPVAREFGYGGLVNVIDEETKSIKACLVTPQDVKDFERMIGRFALEGFKVSIRED
jgi:hypothetical protein